MKTPQALREEATVLRLVSILLKAGVPLAESLELTASNFPGWKEPLEAIRRSRESEETIVETMKGRNWFTPFVPEILDASIAGGSIELGFVWLSSALDRTAKLIHAHVPSEIIAGILFHRLVAIQLGDFGRSILDSLRVACMGGIDSAASDIIVRKVREGDSCTEGLRLCPAYFDELSWTYVDLGEQTGAFPELNRRVAEFKDQMLLLSGPGSCLPVPDPQALADITDYELLSMLISAFGDIPPRILKRFVKEGGIKRTAFATVAEKIEAGAKFSEAMALMPDEFPAWIVRLAQASDRGDIGSAFEGVSAFLKWQHLGIDNAVTRSAAWV